MQAMKPATAGGVPYQVPPEPRRWPSIVLAAAVHAGLLAFLYIGISWQNTAPVEVEAEVWDMKVQQAAPPPPPEPEPVEAPKAEPVPVPKVVQPKVEEPVAPKTPDIALEREKRKAELKKKALEKELEEKQEKKRLALEEEKKREKELKAELKAQKLADELAEKKLAAEKVKADKLAKSKLAAAEQKKLDKLREDQMRRITAGNGASGDAPKATAPRIDSGYLASITSKIKSSTSYAGDTDVPGNPRVVFKVDQLPSGEIVSVKKIKGSGNPGFDDAVEKGIIKSSPLPKKKDGTVERTLEIAFSMKDLD
ncbi:MAG: cell envelope integrity protein TolA [Massilia sp.]